MSNAITCIRNTVIEYSFLFVFWVVDYQKTVTLSLHLQIFISVSNNIYAIIVNSLLLSMK